MKKVNIQALKYNSNWQSPLYINVNNYDCLSLIFIDDIFKESDRDYTEINQIKSDSYIMVPHISRVEYIKIEKECLTNSKILFDNSIDDIYKLYDILEKNQIYDEFIKFINNILEERIIQFCKDNKIEYGSEEYNLYTKNFYINS
jgi:tRNA A37 threonylcarbamoyladenosine biosynthesis protein TsaE